MATENKCGISPKENKCGNAKDTAGNNTCHKNTVPAKQVSEEEVEEAVDLINPDAESMESRG